MVIITVARKPPKGTTVANLVAVGVGGLNIDGCRIQSGTDHFRAPVHGRNTLPPGDERKGKSLGWYSLDNQFTPTNHRGGRWPGNIILEHDPQCHCAGTVKVKGHKGYPNGPGGSYSHAYQESEDSAHHRTRLKFQTLKDNEPWQGHADPDGMETVERWDCVNGCPVARLDLDAGDRKTTWVAAGHQNNRRGEFLGGMQHPGDQGYNDNGGASRFFKQVQDK